MKTFLKIAVSVLLLMIIVIGGGMFYISLGLDQGSRLTINSIDLAATEDGIYNGKYHSGRWTNEVSVTVRDHKITKIDIVKDVTFPKPEWTEQLFNTVIEKQDTNVDVISGATVTSKAYLKSIENALAN